MSRITLVTGGSRSGKSTFGEGLLKDRDDVLYIATAIVTDKEMEDRIERHKKSRNQKWSTYEGHRDLHKVIDNYEERYIFLDCVTVMTTNLLFDENVDFDNISQHDIDNITESIKNQFRQLISRVRQLDKELIVITNEVGWGLVPEYKISRIFRDVAGFVNQDIAKQCDEVYLVACGIPVKLKGEI